jgi:hypothetical protein
MAKSKSKRGPGRPIVFKGNVKSHIIKVARDLGNLSRARESLLREDITISMPTLRKITRAAGVRVSLGRPKKAA